MCHIIDFPNNLKFSNNIIAVKEKKDGAVVLVVAMAGCKRKENEGER